MGFGLPGSKKDIDTLVDLLEYRAKNQGKDIAYEFIEENGHVLSISYQEINLRAQAIGLVLQKTCQVGDRAILIYPPGLELICAYFGCLYAGVIAVPVYPPLNKHLVEKLQRVMLDCEPQAILSTQDIAGKVKKLKWIKLAKSLPFFTRLFDKYFRKVSDLTQWNFEKFKWVISDNIKVENHLKWKKPDISKEDLAFLQYTSGSTGHPKGVMVSHGNLIHNLELIYKNFGNKQKNVCVIWLPPYHDMGLIGGILQPMYGGYPCILMSPFTFLKNPYVWLKTITDYRGTLSGGPNFAYDYCVKKITPEEKRTLDLSSWEAAFSGAEPINSKTLVRFYEAFKECGFRQEAFYPCYGLAEATLFVSGVKFNTGFKVRYLKESQLQKNKVVYVEKDEANVHQLVSCGVIAQKIKIVDPSTGEIRKVNEIGEIWINSPSVTKGYWRNKEATQDAFQGYLEKDSKEFYLRTGDLGFIDENNELYIAGRLKDLIIIHGRNFYPQDIEFTVGETDERVRVGCVAAFSINEKEGEQLAIVAEIQTNGGEEVYRSLAKKIAEAVEREHELAVHSLALIPPKQLPKTTSGKIRRQYTKELLRTNGLDAFYVLTPDKKLHYQNENFQSPRNSIEESLLELYQRVFNRNDISITDTFLSLNGDSLTAMQIVSGIENLWHIELEPHLFFENPTIEDVANLIAEKAVKSIQVNKANYNKIHRPDEIPLSYAQQRLWFLNELYPGSIFYNLQAVLHFNGRLNTNKLIDSINGIILRHEILRTTFPKNNRGIPFQRIHKPVSLSLPLVDLSNKSKFERASYCENEIKRPFNLQDGPLFRFNLIKYEENHHALLLCFHHIIADGWSIHVFINELTALYNSDLIVNSESLASLPVQYSDYSLWEHLPENIEKQKNQLSYWENVLEGVPELINLPLDFSRPVESSYKGHCSIIRINSSLTHRLKMFSKSNQSSLFMTLLTAFALLMSRYAGQEDIVVGTPTAGRNKAEFHNLIGFFVNMLPLRIKLKRDESYLSNALKIKKVILDALNHQDVPYEQIISHLKIERSLSYNPLFQIMFVFQNTPLSNLSFKDLKTELTTTDIMSKFDLTLECREEADDIVCQFEYSTDLFAEQTIKKMQRHWEILLENIITSSEVKVNDLNILTDEEIEKHLFERNNDFIEFPKYEMIHQSFEKQVAKTPNNIALRFEDCQLTYDELNARSNQWARYLQQLGIRPGKLVAICVERSVELVVGLLAILKAGGTYVPLDPEYPEERISYIVNDSNATCLLTQHKFIDKFPTLSSKIIDIENEKLLASQSFDNLNIKNISIHPAYIIYTSGSTGKPKGVPISHANVENLIYSMQSVLKLTEKDSWLSVTTISFDIAGLELYLPLTTGAKIILANYDQIHDMNALESLIQHASIMQSTPSTWKALIDNGWRGKSDLVVLCGGEALSESLAFDLSGLSRQAWNVYGPTETTIYSMIKQIKQNERVTLGKALFNTTLYILNDNMSLNPDGVPGELYIGGAGLSPGYYNRPELTAERFIANPFATQRDVKQGNVRLYKTGDLCRWLSNGDIEYLGRLDHQVKIRGFRIELGEIENVIRKHPAVKETIVMVREDQPEQKQLVAYVVANKEMILEERVLRTYLKSSLPEYMLPSTFVILHAFPMTPNGKLDRKALPQPVMENRSIVFVTPRNTVEAQLVVIFIDVLHVTPISVTDNFFELGGHSLLATQIVSRIRQHFQKDYPLKELFKEPTIEGIARYLHEAGTEEQIVIKAADRAQLIPLSYAQERLWFIDQLDPGNPQYNIPMTLRLKGSLNVPALEAALNKIIERHEVLRTTFVNQDEKIIQVIKSKLKVSIDVIHSNEAQANTEVLEEMNRGFDLRNGPLIRVSLYQTDDNIYLLTLNVHHSIFDGWSMGVFAKELINNYHGITSGRVEELPPLDIQYADFSVWQRDYFNESHDRYQQQITYWQDRLEGAPNLLELPLDRPRPPIQSHRGGVYSLDLPKDLSEQIKRMATNNQSTLFMVLLSAFYILIYKYSGQKDIVVGSPIANRLCKQLEPLIGFFVNTVALREVLDPHQSFMTILASVKQHTLDAFENQDLPFERLVENLKIERSLSYSPVFQVMLALQNNADLSNIKLDDVDVLIERLDGEIAKFDLLMNIDDSQDKLACRIEYCRDLFELETIVRLGAYWQQLLKNIVIKPEQKISEIEILTPSEKDKLLIAWNDTHRDIPNKNIAQLFVEQVVKNPDSIALIYGEQQVTYRVLNERANQLAHYLVKLGVGPDKLVGICLERSIELVVGFLGILKAGGAYVPLDPTYPENRIRYMLNDSNACVLISNSKFIVNFSKIKIKKVNIDEINYELLTLPSTELQGNIHPDNLAYVIYTSGSTGLPKGVQISHQSVVRLIFNQKFFDIHPSDLMTQVCNISFDAVTFEIWVPILLGAKLCIISQELFLQSNLLSKYLIDKKITMMLLPTAFFNQLIDEIPDTLAKLRYIFFGGERADAVMVRKYLRYQKSGVLVNAYGPTECTTISTFYQIKAVNPNINNIPIGSGISNTTLYVLDEALSLCGIGIVGQLYIGGEGLSRGYLNRPDLTAECFIANPFATAEDVMLGNTRLYKSGDLCRWLPDGNIEYIGRIDHQVKIRGFRIELGEIESSLSKLNIVKEAVVLAREDEPGQKRLVAYVITNEGMEFDEIVLRDHLRLSLPEYMMPSAFVQLTEFPLTENGKLDKKALPKPELASSSDFYVAPRNQIEVDLVELFNDVLHVSPISVTDNFFDLGGHSLLATQLISRIKQHFQKDYPLKELFKEPTIESIARYLQRQESVEQETIIPLADRTHSIPLSYSQQQLWFIDQLDPGNPQYNITMVIKLTGHLEVKVLESALNKIIDRHEVLRSNFVEQNDNTVTQVIKPILRLHLEVMTVSEEKAKEYAQAEANKGFDLSRGPLLRVLLCQIEPNTHWLVINVHHSVFDGWSVGVFSKELIHYYNGLVSNHLEELPPLSIQYADFSVWQRDSFNEKNTRFKQQLQYWRDRLNGAPALLELPLDKPRPAIQSYAGDTQNFTLPSGLSAQLSKLAAENQTTLFMVLLTAFYVLLYKYSGQEDLVIGSPIANRQRKELETLIGFFVNTLALREELHPNESFQQLLSKVKLHTIEAYENQEIPFERIVDEIKVERSLSYSPIFQVMFALEDSIDADDLNLNQLKLSIKPLNSKFAKFDLTLTIIKTMDGLISQFEYCSDLFSPKTIENFNLHWQKLLENIISNPCEELNKLEFLTEADQENSLPKRNGIAHDYPVSKMIHILIEEQAEKRPNKIAVISGDIKLTYRELNERANQLAHYLIEQGVGPDKLVSVLLPRSAELIICLLAILKAGGSYLPLDLSFPVERVRYIVENANTLLHLSNQAVIDSMTIKQIDLNSLWPTISEYSISNPNVLLYPHNLAYCIYTSGTTGQPKGVIVTHQSLLNLIITYQRLFKISGNDRIAQFHTSIFDAFAAECWPSLSWGASIHIVPDDVKTDAEKLVSYINDNDITIIDLPTQFGKILLDIADPCQLISLRILKLGGEKMVSLPLKQYNCEIWDTYGPTEATVEALGYCLYLPGNNEFNYPPSIGKPFNNVGVYILNKDLGMCGVGIPGELYLFGVQLARGYLNRPDLTAERFIANPFATEEEVKSGFTRLYKTGDLCRLLPDGNIEYVGRIDHQVKIRGFRVELGEIEATLSRYAGVKEAVVLAREDESDQIQLVAYVIVGETIVLDEQAVRAYLRTKLPDYMIPSAFVALHSFPLTTNGKVDRKALPKPEYGSSVEAYVAPRNIIEADLVSIFTDVLHVSPISVTDNFFTLGGHSLLATQVVSRIRHHFQKDFPLKELFKNPSIESIANCLKAAESEEEIEIQLADRKQSIPLSYSQERLWFIDQLDPGNPQYNIPMTLRLSGNLNVFALKHALNKIIERHEVLRTIFIQENGQVSQVVQPCLNINFDAIPIDEKQAKQYIQSDVNHGFDLNKGPLIRISLYQIGVETYLLNINVHHSVFDGWSVGIFARELISYYHGIVKVQLEELPPLDIQYADFSVWQRENFNERRELYQRQMAYWQARLEGAPSLLELPLDKPRPALQSYKGGTYSFVLPKSLSEKINTLATNKQTTLFMVLLSAFYILLYKYSGQTDIVVGSAIANRHRRQLEPLIGFFVNSLPLRETINVDHSFEALLASVKHHTLEAYEHQDVPFEHIIEKMKVERSLSHTPLFQVMLLMQNTNKFPSLELEGVSVTEEVIDYDIAKMDFILDIEENNEGLVCNIEYCRDLFEIETIKRMGAHWQRLLEDIVALPTKKVSELDILLPIEKEKLYFRINDTSHDYPRDKMIHQLFEEQADRTPDNIAIISDGQELTYKELNIRANQLAHYLQQQGIGPGKLVAICLERSLGLVIGLLAILKAGGAYVPLDPDYPEARISYIVNDAKAEWMLTQHVLLDKFPNIFSKKIDIDDLTLQTRQSVENVKSIVTSKSLAYVIYTSGSTGNPKGVPITHSSVLNLLMFSQSMLKLTEKDRWLSVTTISFDIAGLEIYLPLMTGAVVLLANQDQMHDVSMLKLLMHQSSVMQATPTTWKALIEDGWQGKSDLKILCGGEALSEFLAKELMSLAREGWNMYGPTETTIWSMARKLHKDEPVSLGKSGIYNTTLYILNNQMSVNPIGVPGELYIGGVGLSQGYLNRPDLTAERFVANPFVTQEGLRLGHTRLYKTGDLCRWMPNGEMEYVGRIDHQIKVRGFRIELGEIEATLSKFPAVKEAVVLAREDDPGQKRLVAYVVTHSDAVMDEQDFRDLLRLSLPDYMIPSAFVVLPSFPMTPNGKLDRKALPKPEFASAVDVFVAPRNPLEFELVKIFNDVLHVTPISVTANFFDLGGHSLLATQVVSRIRQKYQKDYQLKELFREPTIAAIAKYLQASDSEKEIMIKPAVRTQSIPLSYSQQRLWFIDQLDPGNPQYNIPVTLRLIGKLNVNALEDALNKIIERHEVLRTVFIEEREKVIQVIHPSLKISLFAIPASEQQAKELIQLDMSHGFDLRKGPLLRVSLYQITQENYVLIVNVHHIIFDGWSIGVLAKELLDYYRSIVTNHVNELAPLDIQYADFSVWQRSYFNETHESYQQQVGYWQDRLKDAPVLLDLPLDKPRPSTQSHAGGVVNTMLSSELTDRLKNFAAKNQSTLFMTLLSAFYVLLYKYSGQTDIVVGSPIANRTRKQLEPLIGFFVNTLALREIINPSQSFNTLLNVVKRHTLEAYEHQDLPFERLVETLKIERSLDHTPLFQVMMVLQNNSNLPVVQMNKLVVSIEQIDSGVTMFDLILNTYESENGLSCQFEYCRDLFESETIVRMGEHWKQLLENIISTPEQAIGKLEIIPPLEKEKILFAWNDTRRNYPENKTIHQIFEDQAVKTPSKIALIFEDQQMTYQMLNERANQMAHYLQKIGVGPDQLVGLCLDRSMELVISLLAILKAGGAYVPLDPEYPKDRLAYMLQDSRAAILISAEEHIGKFNVSPKKLVIIDKLKDELAKEEKSNLNIKMNSQNLAYVIYTSGTTGKPKGVAVAHYSVLGRVIEFAENLQEINAQHLLHQLTFNFDGSTLILWATLVSGGMVTILLHEELSNPIRIRDVIKNDKIDWLALTPSILESLYPYLDDTIKLKLIVIAGEALSSVLVHETNLKMANKNLSMWNVFGPTENSVNTTAYRITGGEAGIISIGKPVADTNIYIVNEALELVPVGICGELCVSGRGITRGYLDHPDLTAEKFIANPFATEKDVKEGNIRLYKTGDKCRLLPDGNIDYIGRLDHQVKIRGFRIELGEIEFILSKHPSVKEAVMMVHQDMSGQKRLVAYIVSNEDKIFNEQEIRAHLSLMLPNYMMPSSFVVLPYFPLTSNGKLDREALPKPVINVCQDGYAAPRNSIETHLVEIFNDVLQVNPIGVTASFFDLGGHSLLATQVVSRIRHVYHVDYPLKLFFKEPTIEAIARYLQQETSIEALDDSDIIKTIDRADFIPLSYTEQYLWHIDELAPGNSQYNIPLSLRLKGKLNVNALEGALNKIIERHEVLRTSFNERKKKMTQIIRSVLKIKLKPINTTEEKAKEKMHIDVNRGFDLRHGPLIRASLYQIDKDEYLFLVNVHHSVFDGWSVGIFAKELIYYYDGLAGSHLQELPPLGIQYADYSVWQQHYVNEKNTRYQQALQYWETRLKGAPTYLTLPADFPRPCIQSHAGSSINFILPIHLTNELKRLASNNQATLFMVLLTSFYILLYQYTEENDFVIGSQIANRRHKQLEPLIGFFANTLALRETFSPNQSFAELLASVKQHTLEAYENQDVPFEHILENLKVERRLSYSPLFQIMFVLHNNAELPDLKLGDVAVSMEAVNYDIINFDLALNMNETNEGVVCNVGYAMDLFEAERIERLCRDWQQLLEIIIAMPEEKISELVFRVLTVT